MPYSHLFKKDKTLCSCNHITIGDAVEFIKSSGIQTVEEWMESDELPAGDKCEACIEDGTENDGVTLAVILAQVKQGKL
jgi:NAD(P)H-nitrite reductase large subunit